MAIDIPDGIFREYDIRGIAGSDLTLEVAEAIGRGYAAYLRSKTGIKTPRISVGRDVRLSSAGLRDALVKGLVESGVKCLDLGECPTPLQYFSMHTLDLDGGIMITGSHNPPEYNGFKISVGKVTIYGREIQELKAVMRDVAAAPPPADVKKLDVEGIDIIVRYLEWIVENFPPLTLERPLKVVVDAGNGTAGLVAPEALKILGCDVVELYCDPDGNFPNHHPDPTVPENLVDLIETVKREGADFGVSYDGDADRIGVVDEAGRIIWGDQLMVILSRHLLAAIPGATIVGEVKCSQTMYDAIERAGGKAVMWKTGHSLIKAKMKELNASLAGEMSGHIFFADRYFGFDDAVYATCRLVEILSERRADDQEVRFSDLLEGVPTAVVTPEVRIECPDELKFEVIERLRGLVEASVDQLEIPKIRDVITIDGLRIVFDDGWALVRASNTQPVLVLRFEAQSDSLIEEYKEFIKELLEKAQPGLDLNW